MDRPAGGNIAVVSDPSKAGESTVPNAGELIAFADAAIANDDDAMERSRVALLAAVGPSGLVDAAGVVGNFQRMNRIADAGGADVDPPVRILSANLRGELGLDDLASAARVKPAGFFSKLIARVAIPIAARVYASKETSR